MMKYRVFKFGNLVLTIHWKSLHPSDFPHVNLTVRYYVGSCRSKMATHASANAINGLAYINRHIVQIAKNVDPNFIGELCHCFASEQ